MSASTRLRDETLNPPPESPENAHLPCSSLLLLLQLMCQKARDERRKPETVIRHTNTHTCTRIHHLPSSSSQHHHRRAAPSSRRRTVHVPLEAELLSLSPVVLVVVSLLLLSRAREAPEDRTDTCPAVMTAENAKHARGGRQQQRKRDRDERSTTSNSWLLSDS